MTVVEVSDLGDLLHNLINSDSGAVIKHLVHNHK